jgi:hypothetical protein
VVVSGRLRGCIISGSVCLWSERSGNAKSRHRCLARAPLHLARPPSRQSGSGRPNNIGTRLPRRRVYTSRRRLSSAPKAAFCLVIDRDLSVMAGKSWRGSGLGPIDADVSIRSRSAVIPGPDTQKLPRRNRRQARGIYSASERPGRGSGEIGFPRNGLARAKSWRRRALVRARGGPHPSRGGRRKQHPPTRHAFPSPNNGRGEHLGASRFAFARLDGCFAHRGRSPPNHWRGSALADFHAHRQHAASEIQLLPPRSGGRRGRGAAEACDTSRRTAHHSFQQADATHPPRTGYSSLSRAAGEGACAGMRRSPSNRAPPGGAPAALAGTPPSIPRRGSRLPAGGVRV